MTSNATFIRHHAAPVSQRAGLAAFIDREVECGPYAKEPGEIGPIVRMVGWYVLDRKVQLMGGETFGTPEEPIGRIELSRTSFGQDTTAVYRLVLGTVN